MHIMLNYKWVIIWLVSKLYFHFKIYLMKNILIFAAIAGIAGAIAIYLVTNDFSVLDDDYEPEYDM